MGCGQASDSGFARKSKTVPFPVLQHGRIHVRITRSGNPPTSVRPKPGNGVVPIDLPGSFAAPQMAVYARRRVWAVHNSEKMPSLLKRGSERDCGAFNRLRNRLAAGFRALPRGGNRALVACRKWRAGGAGGRDRTDTPEMDQHFKCCASTNFATPAAFDPIERGNASGNQNRQGDTAWASTCCRRLVLLAVGNRLPGPESARIAPQMAVCEKTCLGSPSAERCFRF